MENDLIVVIDQETREKLENFNKYYRLQSEINANLNSNVFLGDRENRKCRFCGKTKPEVKFKQDAHVIPQSIGNRYLLSFFECDNCNHFFGSTYEDSFANFFSDSRAFANVKNQNSGKTPKHKENKTGFEIMHTGKSVEIYFGESHPEVLKLDPEKKELILTVTLPSHIPIHVFKAMVKMAMCLIEESEIEQFGNCFKWLLDTTKDELFKE